MSEQIHEESGMSRSQLERLVKSHPTAAGRAFAQGALDELNGPAPVTRAAKPGVFTPKASAATTAKPAVAAKVAPPVKKTLESIREAAFANLNGELPEPKAKEPEVKRNAYGFPLPADS